MGASRIECDQSGGSSSRRRWWSSRSASRSQGLRRASATCLALLSPWFLDVHTPYVQANWPILTISGTYLAAIGPKRGFRGRYVQAQGAAGQILRTYQVCAAPTHSGACAPHSGACAPTVEHVPPQWSKHNSHPVHTRYVQHPQRGTKPKQQKRPLYCR